MYEIFEFSNELRLYTFKCAQNYLWVKVQHQVFCFQLHSKALSWSLTSEVPVEVMQTSHLQLKFIPHGFLQGLPLGGRLGQVFVGL